jgi:hypothetical protein
LDDIGKVAFAGGVGRAVHAVIWSAAAIWEDQTVRVRWSFVATALQDYQSPIRQRHLAKLVVLGLPRETVDHACLHLSFDPNGPSRKIHEAKRQVRRRRSIALRLSTSGRAAASNGTRPIEHQTAYRSGSSAAFWFTFRAMHHGEKLRDVLAAHGKTSDDLARIWNTQGYNARKYLRVPVFDPESYQIVCVALRRLGIQPKELGFDEKDLRRAQDEEDLGYCLADLNAEQLENVKTMLSADKATQERLIRDIVGRLNDAALR